VLLEPLGFLEVVAAVAIQIQVEHHQGAHRHKLANLAILEHLALDNRVAPEDLVRVSLTGSEVVAAAQVAQVVKDPAHMLVMAV
jgi:chorismate mutase